MALDIKEKWKSFAFGASLLAMGHLYGQNVVKFSDVEIDLVGVRDVCNLFVIKGKKTYSFDIEPNRKTVYDMQNGNLVLKSSSIVKNDDGLITCNNCSDIFESSTIVSSCFGVLKSSEPNSYFFYLSTEAH